MKAIRLIAVGVALCALWTQIPVANAQTSNVVADNFTGTSAALSWASFNGACMTAGNNTGSIPACNTLSYYSGEKLTGLYGNKVSNADSSGNGALRLTNGCYNGTCYYDQNGAIISTTPFSSGDGIQVTFTTYTYGGDNSGGHGADGIGFYLLNGSDASKVIAAAANPSNTGNTNTWTLGSWGGSLGYSCSNVNSAYQGMTDAYIGLGMDEFGNFLNGGDNTLTGALNSTLATTGTGVQTTSYTGQSSGSGPEYQPGRIGLRGDGNINLISLTAVNPNATASDVQTVCNNGGTYTYQSGTTTTTEWSYTRISGSGKVESYSGTLYQQSTSKNGNTSYTAAGTTSSTSDGYTGTGTAYGLHNSSYVPITITSNQVSTPNSTTTTFPDYAAIPNGYVNLSSTTPIANETATSRTSATPISYKLQITQDGLLSFWYSWNGGSYIPVLTNQSISASNGPMPSSFLFGFGGSTGGSDNAHEITCFQATPATQAASSVGINVQQTSQVDTGTQIYVAYYHDNNWWGQLQAVEVEANTDGTISFAPTPWWDASCVLTGGSCTSTGATGMQPQGYGTSGTDSRRLITWSGTAGIPFNYGQLTATEKGWLNNDSEGQNRLNYLSGDRSNEVNSSGSGLFRNRTSVLADIIDSSPTWVGAPNAGYPSTWKDLIDSSDTLPENATNAQTYSAFQTAYATRTDIVYEGANDGFMHGFRSGYYTSSGSYAGTTTGKVFTPTDNDGDEAFAYMPQAVLQTIHNASDTTLDYSSTHYGHNYFADSTPGVGDLFYGGQWHTWLVSGLGAGGNAIFALDVTDPGLAGDDTEIGMGQVIGEWSNSSNSPIACYGDTSSSQCINDLGQTYGTPQITRLHNGEWGVIFGNGFNSSTGIAGIYVMTISSAGAVDSIYFLSTGVGAPASSSNAQGANGIAYVTPTDLDGDSITDYVYAGDAWGNVWRFDLTSSTPTNWAVTKYPNTLNGALFTTLRTSYSTTVNGNTVNTTTYQPITTQVLALATQPVTNGAYYVMLEFGTGSVTPQTTTSSVEYAAGPQALYGIWDWFQGTSGTPGAKYAGLSGKSEPSASITTSSLDNQVATTYTAAAGSYSTSSVAISQYETVTANSICFVGTTCGTSAGTQYGWYLNLLNVQGVANVGVNSATGTANQTEQVIYNPIEIDGAFLVDTTIPANNSPLTCSANTAQGFTMALNPVNGGAFPESFFEAPTGGFTQVGGQSVSGVALGATGSASILNVNGHANLVAMTPTGPVTTPANPQQTANGSRVTWIQLH
jgi:type IV pilus assembly protein PilY1